MRRELAAPEEQTRRAIADTLHVQPSEIYFTSGGTESDNWALKSTMEAYSGFGRHMITTRIEHHAIGNTCEYLKIFPVLTRIVVGRSFKNASQIDFAVA